MSSKPFLHTHPYEPFLFPEATKLIVGTLPPPRFSTGELKPEDVDFCYGSCNGMLWPILDRIFNLGLKYETTAEAVEQRKTFLLEQRIGVCDIVHSAEREKIDASDLGMQNVVLRDLLGYLKEYPNIDTLLFTGGNSKNGPEYFFRRLLKEHNLKLKVISNEVPRIHELELALTPSSLSVRAQSRTIKTVSLTAPSGAANRAVGSLPLYQQLKSKNPEFNTVDFRVMQYRSFFER
ncbi:uracil-DNA glycosylase family protein [Flagellimonas olearia]|uniref:Uracil-DNA glycosylase family protein n=1 Tax=Flagellimonas olearia TaxID=552546 RepID=A0A6I1E1Q9_9FLAO|nr:uracil-DNA glycosylase family protein [Allomuricauda olearia]KAB7529517.1 uracil-DNA glycosylase family protein [Allomuricauda olearia]